MIIVSQDREIALNMRYVHDIYIAGKDGNGYRLMASTDDLISGTTLGLTVRRTRRRRLTRCAGLLTGRWRLPMPCPLKTQSEVLINENPA